MRSRRLKLGTLVGSGQMYRVYRNQAAAYLSLFSSFFFLSNFQTLKFFITFSSQTVRPRRLKLGTPEPLYNTVRYNTVLDITRIGTGPQMAIKDSCSCITYAFYSQYNTVWIANMEIFLDPENSVIKRLWCTFLDSGQMYHVYRNQAGAAYLSLQWFYHYAQ